MSRPNLLSPTVPAPNREKKQIANSLFSVLPETFVVRNIVIFGTDPTAKTELWQV